MAIKVSQSSIERTKRFFLFNLMFSLLIFAIVSTVLANSLKK